jgi:hypothetical protein
MVLLTYLLLVGDPDDHKSTTSYKAFLSLAWYCGVQRSNLLFPDQVQRLNITLFAMTTTEV